MSWRSWGRFLVIVTAVGEKSEWGMTMSMVMGEAEYTPLQEKLEVVATQIGKLGGGVAVVCFVVLTIYWAVRHKGFNTDEIDEVLDFFLFAVTIVVVAIPEGLPLAVTLSPSYSMKKMMQDNNFVRVLAACETMGGATAICSDKTGTLTENKMTVTEGWFGGRSCATVPALAEVGAIEEAVEANVCLNSTAYLTEGEGTATKCVGSSTEGALLVMVKNWGKDIDGIRDATLPTILRRFQFSSAKKMSSCLVQRKGGGCRLYCKGAAEIVLGKCVSYVAADGAVAPLSEEVRGEIAAYVTQMASNGLRTLCLGYADFATVPDLESDRDLEENMTATCIVGIKDPLRKETPGAIRVCQEAGICVRMVTGDNIHTAKHIAADCGILTDGLSLEGPEFRKMEDEYLKAEVLPRLQVLARSSPKDKHRLVSLLKECGEVVSVTGDGTNDAPALKESHVGLAMGISGTEVAKEASDIVILDDNFNSIVKSIMWGRSVHANIRKFLQFQLTINLVALILAALAALTNKGMPLNVLQLLWVNLIMDSMAALALATEAPTEALLKEKPHGKDEPLISRRMKKHILVQMCYQLLVLLVMLYGLEKMGVARYEFTPACKVAVEDAFTPQGLELFTTACAAEGPRCDGFLADLDAHTRGQVCDLQLPSAQDVCGGGDDCALWKSALKVGEHFEEVVEKDYEAVQKNQYSFLFNVFIMMQFFNELNARKIEDELNVFENLGASRIFHYVLVGTLAFRVIIMETPINQYFHVHGLTGVEWGISIAIGLVGMPVALLTKLLSAGPPAAQVVPKS